VNLEAGKGNRYDSSSVYEKRKQDFDSVPETSRRLGPYEEKERGRAWSDD